MTGGDPVLGPDRQVSVRLVDLAADAFTTARADSTDPRDAEPLVDAIVRILDEFPRGGLQMACLLWCSTLLNVHPEMDYRQTEPPCEVGFQIVTADDGEAMDVDSATPPTRWAARFVLAFARGDKDTLAALWASAQSVPELLVNAYTLVTIVVTCMASDRSLVVPVGPDPRDN